MTQTTRRPLLFAAFFLLLLSAVPETVAAQEPPDSLARATALLRQGKAEAAVELLRPMVTEPDAPGAVWSTLGRALRQLERYEESARALRLALRDEDARETAIFELARTMAHLDADRAFFWLREVHATGSQNLTALSFDPDLKLVADDPRALEFRPTEQEFADPFVEEVRVLREWRGEGKGDQFGWIARRVEDVDGDGIHDVVTSAPTWGPEGSQAGRIYLYGGGSGDLLWTVDGSAQDQLGNGVESAGDVNADGIADVVAGAPSADYAVVLSGKDGTILLRLTADTRPEGFGMHVAGVGDVDGDGHGDLLVGAPQADVAGEDSGQAYLFSGRTGETIRRFEGPGAKARLGATVGGATVDGETLLILGAPGVEGGGRTYVHRGTDATQAFVIEPGEHGRSLGGMFVSVVGDVDGDGTGDVYASDWWNSALGPMTGRAFVHSGATGERLHTFTGEAAWEGFGIGVADAGDVDGDGHADLAIGAWRHAGAAPMGGKVTVFSGKDGSVLRTITGKIPGETLGFDSTHLGDVDGDGVVDLLLTSAWSAIAGERSGRVWVVAGQD